MSKPKLSIILPSLRHDNLDKCLTSIYANSRVSHEIIIITNEEISKVFQEDAWNPHSLATYIIDDKCIGTCYANQLGLEKAQGEFVVALSDDARVCPHWDEHMINFLERWGSHQNVIGNFRVFDSTGEMPHIGYYGRQFSMFPILRRKTIDRIGGFYRQEFHAFYGDPDLGMRVAEHGGQVATCDTAFIYHPYNPDKLHNDNKAKYWKVDEETFIKKWGHLGEFKACEVLK